MGTAHALLHDRALRLKLCVHDQSSPACVCSSALRGGSSWCGTCEHVADDF